MDPVCFKPTPDRVRAFLIDARKRWLAADWSTDLCDLTEQVLAEALNNIAEHAHPDPENAGETWIVTRFDAASLIVEIRDNGLPMPGLKVPESTLPEIDCLVEDLPEGGFGWYMIQVMAKTVDYRRVDDWNILQLTLDASI